MVLLLFFLFAAICVSAQIKGRDNPADFRETRIYVPPIDGIGVIEDMAYFYKQITGEITRQYRQLGRTRRTSDYVITGRVMPIAELDEEIEMPEGAEEDENVLFVELFNNETDEIIAVQYITYTIPDATTEEALSVIIYNMLSGIPDLLEGIAFYDNWRNKRLYLNASFLWTPRNYIGIYAAVHWAGVGAEITVDYHILSFLAVSLGAEISQEWVVLTKQGDVGNESTDMILDIPLAVKFVFRPLDNFMLEPYLGAQYNISLLQTTGVYPVSWLAGAQLGIRLGFGILTIDPRFSMDFGKSWTVFKDNTYEYWRYSLHLGLGFKLGFFNRIKSE